MRTTAARGVRGGRAGLTAGLLLAGALVLSACLPPKAAAPPVTTPQTPAPARLTVFPGPTGPVATPPWWKGDCDSTDNPGSHPLGASYRGVEVCGPRPSASRAPSWPAATAGTSRGR